MAIGGTKGAKARVLVDNLALEGPAGAAEAVRAETFRRRVKKLRIVPVSLIWG